VSLGRFELSYKFLSPPPTTQFSLLSMARNLTRLNPQASARTAAGKVRDAFNGAKARTGGAGQLVALAAGGLLLAFILLAALAPVLMRAPAIISSLIGFVLLALVLISTAVGGVALWRMIKAGAMEANSTSAQGTSIYSLSAIEAALSDAEDAGLRVVGARTVQDAMTGRVSGRPVAVMRADGVTYAVIRLRDAVPASLLLAPGRAPWPLSFPNDGALTPVGAPAGIDALAWSTAREVGMALSARLATALTMSLAGGEVPFVSVRGRALVMMWRRGDVGTAAVIAGEVAKAFA
jgi:hypothetical protein